MNITELIDRLRNTPDCTVLEPCGLPEIEDGLPEDMREFYKRCGGARLFGGGDYWFEVVSPQDVIPANPVIVGEPCEYDISARWYIICKNADNDYITIDMAAERLGRCYDSFWDRHGVAGECAIVARSFTELLERLYEARGECLYWLSDSFEPLGDAYD